MEEESENNDIVVSNIADNAIDIIGDAVSSVPAPIRKNAIKAFGQLCTAAVDIPVAHLEGIAAEKRAATAARVKLIHTEADQIANQMLVDPQYVKKAVKKFGEKILNEQVNLDAIAEIAAAELKTQQEKVEGINSITNEISSDWLNAFEREASTKSSDEMRFLFGKILAGEIARPASFSIKTVKLISELDNRAAKLFQLFCSLSTTLKIHDHIIDSRVISLGDNAGSNSLKDYGLSFSDLNILQEYGLIISDYNSYVDYKSCVANENDVVHLPFFYQGKYFALKLQEGEKPRQTLRVNGVGLSSVGKELWKIIDISPTPVYTEKLKQYFQGLKFDIVQLG